MPPVQYVGYAIESNKSVPHIIASPTLVDSISITSDRPTHVTIFVDDRPVYAWSLTNCNGLTMHQSTVGFFVEMGSKVRVHSDRGRALVNIHGAAYECIWLAFKKLGLLDDYPVR